MLHTIEELGEHADDNADGGFWIWQVPKGLRKPKESWGSKIGSTGAQHFGETPNEAVKKALDAHDRIPESDRRVKLYVGRLP